MTEVTLPGLAALTSERIASSLAAIDDILECHRVLEKGGLNLVGEVLRGQGPFYEMDHYPKADVYDRETGSQYYYHAHRENHPEHGHFHLFLRTGALPSGAEPLVGPRGEDTVLHLVAISMDAWGFPTDLFTVNRWVTDDSWLPAEAIIPLLGRFGIDHAFPSWPVNRWLTAMVRCFRPQIEALLRHRDQMIVPPRGQDLVHALENRALEVTGTLSINVEAWAQRLRTERDWRVRVADYSMTSLI